MLIFWRKIIAFTASWVKGPNQIMDVLGAGIALPSDAFWDTVNLKYLCLTHLTSKIFFNIEPWKVWRIYYFNYTLHTQKCNFYVAFLLAIFTKCASYLISSLLLTLHKCYFCLLWFCVIEFFFINIKLVIKTRDFLIHILMFIWNI